MPGSKIMFRLFGLLAIVGMPAAPLAADDRAIEPPPLPPPLVSGEALEPEVTIRKTERETVYEYRRNGQLVLVRVQPQVGPPYHFIDTDGDGILDYQPGEPVQSRVNQWILFSW